MIAEALADLGLDPAKVVAEASDAEHKPKLRAQTDQARTLGIFGAPSFVAKGELFFGGDRLESALRWSKR